MNRFTTPLLSLFAAFALAACGFADGGSFEFGNQSSTARTTGLALTSDVFADTDIEGMEFTVEQVDCRTGEASGPTASRIVDYEDMYLPGGIAVFEDEPFDSDSQHMFADAYFVLDAGCFDVQTQPLRADELASRDCKPAHKTGVRVRDGRTTEVLLINQCKGAARGGLDVIGSINHPPQVDDLVFEDSKFITTCGPQRVCVTASDPDDDPLEFEFRQKMGGSIALDGDPEFDPETGQWTACALVDVEEPGEYGFIVRVWDLDGNGDRIQQLLRDQDPRDSRGSRDALRFPMYSGVMCQEEDPIDEVPDDEEPGDEDPDDDSDDAPDPDPPVIDPPVIDLPINYCTRTRGYWSTHYDGANSESRDIDWPAPHDESHELCEEPLLDLVGASSEGGDIFSQLAAQWIAASLNVAAGASAPSTVLDALDDAHELLMNNCSEIPAAEEPYAEGYKDLFDDYNNGETGPGHCE